MAPLLWQHYVVCKYISKTIDYGIGMRYPQSSIRADLQQSGKRRKMTTRQKVVGMCYQTYITLGTTLLPCFYP